MNRIKALREDRDLRQVDVAQHTGIDQRTLSNYETGKTNPDSYAIIKLSKFYSVTCDYLLGVTDVNFSNLADVSEELERIKNVSKPFKGLLKENNSEFIAPLSEVSARVFVFSSSVIAEALLRR